MAREILFRGKRKDNGDLVYGFYYTFRLKSFIGMLNEYGKMWCLEVEPESVGRFTGKTDKNGKRIFEDDIIRYITPDTAKATGVVRFGEYGTGGTIGIGFYVEWVSRDGAGWLRQDFGFWAKYRDIEVIGNIHDNPDLLNGTES